MQLMSYGRVLEEEKTLRECGIQNYQIIRLELPQHNMSSLSVDNITNKLQKLQRELKKRVRSLALH